MKSKIIIATSLSLVMLQLIAQDKSNIKFGKIDKQDFIQQQYPTDSNANAIVIGEIGSTEMVGNNKGGFSLEFKKFRRVHILNKKGYDAADVDIDLYTQGDAEEELKGLKAVTYNLENGKIVETELDKSGIFKNKINKNHVIKKFTFPNIKEGSIVEYEYKIKSDFTFNLQPWEFQGAYPCLWSEYNVSIPEFYYYITLFQGYQPFYINSSKDRINNFSVTDNSDLQSNNRVSFSAGITDYRWVMKDIPALKEESYTSTINNHIARIEFQLAELRPPFTPKKIMASWPEASADLMKDEDFGLGLKRDNSWLNDAMKEATSKTAKDAELAKNIFQYVRDNFSCNNYNRKYLENPLKTVLKNHRGNVAEINLLLTAMLLKAGLQADPVLLSTRSHGYVYSLYPLLDRFNYVIARVRINNEYYFLDASHPNLGFNRLPDEVYNGQARVINTDATPVNFIADSLKESKLTSVIIINDEKGNLTGSMRQAPGYYESLDLRDQIKEKGRQQFFNDIKKDFNTEINITNPGIDSLDKYDEPINIHYDFDIKTENKDLLYFNPMFGEGWKENPFKSAIRTYPVEMPYTIDETYLLKLDVPDGYVIDELPKQLMVQLNDNDEGFFEYLVSESGGSISMRSRIIIKRAFFKPDEYETLREFFKLIVKKQAEQIVFKKKK